MKGEMKRIETGVRNLDAILHGGLPEGSVCVFGGPPGSGKTILSQQICFHNATPAAPALIFNTLSEPTAKTLRYLTEFSFFDPKRLNDSVYIVDLGVILREKGLERTLELIMEQAARGEARARRHRQLQGLRRPRPLEGGAAQVRLRGRGQPDGVGDDGAPARRILAA